MWIKKDTFGQETRRRALEKNHLKHWGEVGGEIGYGYLNGAYILGQLMFGGRDGNKKAELMFDASFYTLGFTQGLKALVTESRLGYPEEPDSFPSGHSSFAFAFASMVTANDGWVWGGLAHLAATFISFSRINDGWHYIHDVVAGMTIGMSYGWGVYFNHKNHGKKLWFSLLPNSNFDGLNLNFATSF